MTQILTRKDQQAAIEAAGINGAAAEAILSILAPDRHRSRVRAAMIAALVGYLAHPEADAAERLEIEAEAARIVDWTQRPEGERGPLADCNPDRLWDPAIWSDCWTICALELGGVGGVADSEGNGTERSPIFGHLGKGRRQASDGAAWDAAIREAAEKFYHLAPYPPRLDVVQDEAEGWQLATITGPSADDWRGVETCGGQLLRWAAAFCARRLRGCFLNGDPKAAAWGAAYNAIHAEAVKRLTD